MRVWPALLAAAMLALPGAALAEERILRFVSDVTVAQNGDLIVAESIRVRAEGDSIQRGIQRDFPTRYRDKEGARRRVGFEVESVERDGRPEPWEMLSIDNGERVRIGDADVLLPLGEHDYTIRYRTTHQLGFFPGYDELYWNATGNGWTFPIDVAEARIRLPRAAEFGNRAFFTGPVGAKDGDAEVSLERPGEIVFRTARPLGVGEGLTVAVAWPKGIIDAPAPRTQSQLWLGRNGPPAVGLLGLLGVLAYYFHAWRRAGRGPKAGTVVPIFAPPKDMSPAAVRYVSKMGFDNRAFAAAIVDCGVRGRLRLIEGEKGFLTGAKTTIERVDGATPLPAPETAMLGRLFAEGDSVLMDNANHTRFGEAEAALKKGLESAYKKAFFVANWIWSLSGAVLLFVVLALTAAMLIAVDPFAEGSALAVPAAAIAGLGLGLWLLLLARDITGAGRIVAIIGASLLLVGGMIAAFAACVLAIEGGQALPLLAPLIALPVAVSAFAWMAAPTKAGRDAMDRIAGFRHYLSITEEQRLEALHPPEKTPELFERFLPYAIALKVENRWAGRFTSVLAASAAAGQAHNMHWYSGHSDPWGDPDGFADRIGGSLASTISSASTAPGSSSGSSGGGSSGGGGGGGGGSGW